MSSRTRPRVLILSNVFGRPWERTRGMFNQIIFEGIASSNTVTVLVPVSIIEVLKHWRKSFDLFVHGDKQWPNANFFVYLHIPKLSQPFNAALMFLCALLQCPKILLVEKWDCYFASWLFPDAVAMSWLAKLRSIKFIAHAIGSDVNLLDDQPLQRQQILSSLKSCRALITVSQDLQEKVREMGFTGRLVTIYNGVDSLKFRPASRAIAKESLQLVVDSKMILFVGRIVLAKGVFELVNAFLQISQRSANEIQLVFVGGGSEVSALQALCVSHGITSKVHFAGLLPPEQLGAWYNAADIFCLPSYMEGVPNVVMEAMACGTPTVASDVGGIAEVLHVDSGVLVKPKNTVALEMALEAALCRDWDRDQIRQQALRYKWEDCFKQIQGLIED
jgi:glycosyltransferase involved in cell wall biosynthesis